MPDLQTLACDVLATLEDDLDISVLHSSITPSTITMRVQAPATWSPIGLASRIKRELARAIISEHPAIKTRVPSIFTRASYLRTCGTPHADGAMTFLARERGERS